ncbi:MAG: tetratricopeptide repeat protein, partial [Hyphomicrobium sp.]
MAQPRTRPLLSACLFALALACHAMVASTDCRAQVAREEPRSNPDIDAAIRRGEYAAAVALLEKSARAGDAAAQYQLSSFYRAGRGVAVDDAMAFKWMRAAAEKGHAKAQYSLGAMYLGGRGAPL